MDYMHGDRFHSGWDRPIRKTLLHEAGGVLESFEMPSCVPRCQSTTSLHWRGGNWATAIGFTVVVAWRRPVKYPEIA